MLSKLHHKCEKCKYKDSCNNKRMVACAIAKKPSITKSKTISISSPVMQPITRDTSVQAQIAEKVAEQLEKDFYKRTFALNCEFNKS